jgi:hypothetical protein
MFPVKFLTELFAGVFLWGRSEMEALNSDTVIFIWEGDEGEECFSSFTSNGASWGRGQTGR